MRTANAAVLAAILSLSFSAAAQATPVNVNFASTSEPSAWLVSHNITAVDVYGDSSKFLTSDSSFEVATQITNRADFFIANNSSGTQIGAWVGDFTQFVFRQQFDLTGLDPATANLQFQWAADDVPQWGNAAAGNWMPQLRLNGGEFQGQNTAWYDYTRATTVQLSSGFVPGTNTIDFYVQGNGVTDGFSLNMLSFTAEATPEPASIALMLAGLTACIARRRRR